MPIDEKQRLKKQDAGIESGIKRSFKNAPRNENICLAFVYLTGGRQSKRANKRAEEFLKENGFDIDNIDEKASNPCQELADCTGIGIRQIQNIIKAGDVRSNEHNDRDENIARYTLACRFKEARNLNGYTKQRAASFLGISPVELARYEQNKGAIPFSVIKKAADIYNVTADFLLGVYELQEDEDMMIQQRRYAREGFERIVDEATEKFTADSIIRKKEFYAAVECFPDLIKALVSIEKSALRFRELNPGADINMRGGAAVLDRISDAIKIAHKTTVKLVRARALPLDAFKVFKNSKNQD